MARLWKLLLLLWLTSCTVAGPEPPAKPVETLHIIWPEPPEPARIEFVAMFSHAEDLGLRESFSRKMRDLLTGSNADD